MLSHLCPKKAFIIATLHMSNLSPQINSVTEPEYKPWSVFKVMLSKTSQMLYSNAPPGGTLICIAGGRGVRLLETDQGDRPRAPCIMSHILSLNTPGISAELLRCPHHDLENSGLHGFSVSYSTKSIAIIL